MPTERRSGLMNAEDIVQKVEESVSSLGGSTREHTKTKRCFR